MSDTHDLKLISIENGTATVKVHPYLVRYSALKLSEMLAEILAEHDELTSIVIKLRE